MEDMFDETKESIVTPTTNRLNVKRKGQSITRKIPKPIIIVDTREQLPFTFTRFSNWIAETNKKKLDDGDYSVQGMEHLLSLERKSLADLIATLLQHRKRFFKLCESPYGEEHTQAHPNAVSGSLDALEAKFGIPVIYTSQYRPLAEEKAASWLSKHFTYWYLEENGFGRVLQEGDL